MDTSHGTHEDKRTIAIETLNLTKRFGKFVAVNNLTLSIRKGEIFGFLGPNGAGKSTTIRMLCGILEPTSGEGSVGGYSLIREPEKIKRVIGYMSQSFGLYQDLTVEENLRFYARLYIADRKTCMENIEKAIELVQLDQYRKTLAANLSGGWRQRLALACAIVHEPQIIFLDEPTAGIDPVSRRVLWDFLYELSHAGTTLFVTTHYMEEAERCNRIGFIWQGNLVACSTPEGVKSSYVNRYILNLKCRPIDRAYALLKHDMTLVRDVNFYGDELHIVVDDAQTALPAIHRVLADAGIAVTLLEQIQPSIEDVFVALAQEKKNGSPH
ncbi:MAG: ABC transporter ATP-binding protein [Desulfobacterota bacterium]|nr:ABC transporter ATP-binding protein [Thermodesulfobacteriota bacterium]